MRCIACHQHADFPQATATQGPNLSRVGAKLGLKPFGAQWLYSWIKNPSHYHARTVMPNTLLTPVKEADGKMSDPIADVTAFLMKSTQDWKPTDVPAAQELIGGRERSAFESGAISIVKEKFPAEKAKQFVEEGIPLSRASGVKGDEAMLLRDDKVEQTPAEHATRLLKYVGRRSISKYGCSGCHDIPGFEDAKSIGTSLADWGRKDPARLAFEQIGEYITQHAWPQRQESGGKGQDAETAEVGHDADMPSSGRNAAPEDLDYAIAHDLPPTQGWLMEKLLGHEREGFLWQKLRAPRSYDFKKTENKGYNERLRMPQFSFQRR